MLGMLLMCIIHGTAGCWFLERVNKGTVIKDRGRELSVLPYAALNLSILSRKSSFFRPLRNGHLKKQKNKNNQEEQI